MVAGGIGALAATVPVELALRVSHWRVVFAGLSAVTLVVGGVHLLRVPDIAKPAQTGRARRAACAACAHVFRHPRFWWIAPLGAVATGGVHGDPGPVGGALADGGRGPHARHGGELPPRDERRRHGGLRRRSACSERGSRGTASTRATCSAAASRSISRRSLLIVLRVPGELLWWLLYGSGCCRQRARLHRAERGVRARPRGTHQHVAQPRMFVRQLRRAVGHRRRGRSRCAPRTGSTRPQGCASRSLVVLAAYVAAFLWFVRGLRRYGSPVPAVAPA